MSAINAALDSGRYVEIRGDAGVGKSGVLRHFAELFQEEGRIIVLSPGRTPQRGWPALRAQLGFDGTARELLLDLAADGGAALIIDNLDSFDDVEQLTVNDLVREAATVPGLAVLATARRNFGAVEPSWLDTDAIKALQLSPAVVIDELTPGEIAELSAAEPRLAALLDETHPARDVVRNLYRLGRLALRDASDPAPTTERDMAEQWWNSADGRGDPLHRERARVLRHLALLALDGTFTYDVTDQPAAAVTALVASESLRDLGNDRVTFHHDVLRQWAIGNLLTVDASLFAKLPLTKPAPEVVAQGVELAARFLIERHKDDADWLVMLARMSGPGVHPSWRRATLLALVHSDVADRLLDQESGRLLENDAALLREMVLTVMAVDVIPASQLLIALGVDPAQVPGSFFAPTAPSWSHLARWLLRLGAAVPAKALSDVVSFYSNFLQGSFGYAPMAGELLASMYAWLIELEDTRYDSSQGKTFAGKVGYRHVDVLRDKLRTVFCLFSNRVPELAAAYLNRIGALDQDHGAAAAVMKFRGTLAQAAPKELASLTAGKLIARRTKRDRRDDLDFRGPFQHIDSDFLPPSPAQGPFFELLIADPAQGLALIRQLVGHAIYYHAEGQDPGDDGFRLELDGEERFFPWTQTYAWSRGNNNFYAMSSGLMALEAWAHRRIEAGDDVNAVLKDVLGPPGSCAAYLLIAVDIVILHWPKTRAAAVPFLSCPELLSDDRTRQAHDDMRQPDIFGLGALQKEPSGQVTLENLKRRRSRASPLEYLLGHYTRSNDDGLRTVLTTKLQAASQRLGASEPDSTFADPRLMARFAVNLLDPANWHDQVVALADGSSQAVVAYVSPPAEADHIARLQEASSQRFTETTIVGMLYVAMDDATRSSPELAARGVAWAKDALLSETDEYDRDGTLRDNAIRGAALILLRDGTDDLHKEHGSWAEQVLMNARTSSDNGSSRMRQELSFNPLGTAFAGLAELYRREPTSGRLRALLEIAADQNPAGARGFARTVSALAAADERIPKAIVRCALSGVARPMRDWKLSEEGAAARVNRIAAAKVQAIDAELAWIEGPAPEPAWPNLTTPNARSRVRPRHYLRSGAGSPAAPARQVEVEPEVVIDDQAAGLWLDALDPVLDAERRPWLRELAAAYAEFSAWLNGFG
ncbi:MAG: ATP-binding protein, partial [Rhizobiaceae bacterium]